MTKPLSKSAQINIAALLITPIAATILLYIFTLLDFSSLSWKPYPENLGTDTFGGVLLSVAIGHLVIFLLIASLAYRFYRPGFVRIAIATIVTQLLWRFWAGGLGEWDCKYLETPCSKVSAGEDFRITLIVTALLPAVAAGFYFLVVRRTDKSHRTDQ